jgi:hypothetical protein
MVSLVEVVFGYYCVCDKTCRLDWESALRQEILCVCFDFVAFDDWCD